MPRENVGKGRAYTMFRRLNSLKEAKGGNHAQVIFHTGCDLSPNPGCDLNRNPRLRMPRENVGKGRVYDMPSRFAGKFTSAPLDFQLGDKTRVELRCKLRGIGNEWKTVHGTAFKR